MLLRSYPSQCAAKRLTQRREHVQNVGAHPLGNPIESLKRQRLAARALNLKSVKLILVSFEPFSKTASYKGPVNQDDERVKSEIRNDRQPTFFRAELGNSRSLVFKTSGMHAMDVHMRFNKLLANPILGPSGAKKTPQLPP